MNLHNTLKEIARSPMGIGNQFASIFTPPTEETKKDRIETIREICERSESEKTLDFDGAA